MKFKICCVKRKDIRITSILVATLILLLMANRKKEKEDVSTTMIKLIMPSRIFSNETSAYNLYDYRTKTIKENILNKLSKDLRGLIAKGLPPRKMKVPKTCLGKAKGNSCKNGVCLQLRLPEDPQKRLEQLIRPENLHPNAEYVNVMLDMGNAIPGFYDIILITGASSNHYEESKLHLSNIHTNVLPHLRNFTFIYYNLGLTTEQKEDISSMCRCHMLDFPFDKFPKFVSSLKCFSWKPIVINAHAPHCNIIHWMDTSIRYPDHPSHLKKLLEQVRVRGFLSFSSFSFLIPHMTLREMFHFFGDEACVYLPYVEARAGFNIFLNKPLIKWGILEPWTACALNESCMCLDYIESSEKCLRKKRPHVYGVCHRYDQSALSIIVRKLFREKSHHLFLPDEHRFFTINRLKEEHF